MVNSVCSARGACSMLQAGIMEMKPNPAHWDIVLGLRRHECAAGTGTALHEVTAVTAVTPPAGTQWRMMHCHFKHSQLCMIC